MTDLSKYYEQSIYNTEGKFIGNVTEVVLNIKKGRISFFKTKTLTSDNRNPGLRDVIRNSMRLLPEDEDVNPVSTQDIIDIPYELVSAVGDIILVDQEKLIQYQTAQQKRLAAATPVKPAPKKHSIKK